jgi:hypothetical protein
MKKKNLLLSRNAESQVVSQDVFHHRTFELAFLEHAQLKLGIEVNQRCALPIARLNWHFWNTRS